MRSATPAADVFEDQGVLWKQDPGGTSTFAELLAARSFFIDTYQDALWNPWVTDDNKAELDAAMVPIREWTRAEPDLRQWTAEETEAYLDEGRRAREAERAETEARWEHDKTRFDPELFAARRSLLEQESLQLHFQSELEEFRSGRRYPAMAQEKREKATADLEVKLARCNESLLRLRRTVGDPELVVNERGQLPRDRREANRLWFKFDREREVRALRERLPCLRSELKASTDKEQRKDLRAKVARDDAELTYWLGISPLTAEEMCSECATPLVGHGWVSVGLHGAHPCPAWPGWAARIEKARKMFFEMVERNREPSPPPTPKPEPIATIPSGLPVAEVVARLSELQALLPDAVVKRGRANRWELWPPSD